MKNKCIFLDIDGVLNCLGTLVRHFGFLGIDPTLVKRFNRIIKETNAKVVLSSTWRHNPNWLTIMQKNGLICEFLGRTDRLSGKFRGNSRGLEINKWLTDNPDKWDKYCILDDDNDMLPDQKLFQTTFKSGLTEKITQDIINYLNETKK